MSRVFRFFRKVKSNVLRPYRTVSKLLVRTFREGNQPDRESCRNESRGRAEQGGRNWKEHEGTGRNRKEQERQFTQASLTRRFEERTWGDKA
jgi:hypothetical protein